MTKKGHGQHLGASDHRGADSTHHEAHQLGGDGGHIAEMNHANADHAQAVPERTDGDEIAKHREAHFGMSPAPTKAAKPVKREKTSKHANARQ